MTANQAESTTRTKNVLRNVPPNVYIFALTFYFFTAGLILYLFAMVAGIWLIPDLIKQQTFRGPSGWTLAHLFVLGWATMIAMGASFQLTQVLLRTSIYSRLLGYVHFFVYVLGLLVLSFSFYFAFSAGMAWGGSLVVLGVILYVCQLAVTFIRKREWNVYIFGVGFSLIDLLVTVGLGLLMGWAMARGWTPPHYEHLFATHVWLGIGGWLSGLIITYSFKLLPMFYNSPRRAVGEAYLIIGLFQSGVWLQVISRWMEWNVLEKLSLMMILISLALFVLYAREVRIHSRLRDTKNPGGAVSIAYRLISLTAALVLLWILVDLFFPNVPASRTLGEMMVLFLILGWISATILSLLSKIVPFLWWAYRFHTKWEKKSRVLLSDMTADKTMKNWLYAYLAGVVLVYAAYLFAQPALATLGQITAVLSAILYIIELIKVFRF